MRFIDNKDGTITDTETGLMWQQETLSTMSYDNAVLTCSELDLAGHKDWRLPTIKELISIVDFDRHSPACDPVFRAQTNSYWSSSTYQTDPTLAWYVFFDFGDTVADYKAVGYYVRAVRTGSCPRPSRQPVPKTDTTQLKALRDALASPRFADDPGGKVTVCGLGALFNAAIASLEAAKQPEPCAGFVCEGWTNGNVGCTGRHKPTDDDCHCNCCDCKQPKSAHQQPSAEQAEAKLAALKGQEPVANAGARHLRWLINTPAAAWSHTGVMLYAAPAPPPDSVPREQHEAALAQARREAGWSLVGAAQQAVLALGYDTECRIRNAISKDCGCAGCHRKWAKERLEAAIRALAEKGGDVLLGKTDCTECDVSFPCYGGNKPCIRD